MRTTLNIDDDLLRQATELSGIAEKTALVRGGLRALIERETARRLDKLGGSHRRNGAGRTAPTRGNSAVAVENAAGAGDVTRRCWPLSRDAVCAGAV